MEKVRLQKIIADSGYCSRRKAEEYIEQGCVKVNGRPVSIGDKADPKSDIITVNGEKIASLGTQLRYIKLYKPRGYVTTMADTHGRKIVTDLLDDIDERVYPVGRLDKDSGTADTHKRRRTCKRHYASVPSYKETLPCYRKGRGNR